MVPANSFRRLSLLSILTFTSLLLYITPASAQSELVCCCSGDVCIPKSKENGCGPREELQGDLTKCKEQDKLVCCKSDSGLIYWEGASLCKKVSKGTEVDTSNCLSSNPNMSVCCGSEWGSFYYAPAAECFSTNGATAYSYSFCVAAGVPEPTPNPPPPPKECMGCHFNARLFSYSTDNW